VTGYIRRMCMQGKEAFNRVGTSACMHADGWMDGCGGGAASSRQRQRAGGSINREACIIVQAAKLAVKLHWVQADERKQHKQHGTPKGSTKLQGLGEPQRARERTPCHAMLWTPFPAGVAAPCAGRQAERDSSCLIDGENGEPDPTTSRAQRTTRSLVKGVATTTTLM
jgi:hypothetical protein